jgi:aerobic C4-dicarboxylate transport protein
MSEARAITNLIGNGVATMVIAKWEGALDIKRAQFVLETDSDEMAEEPEHLVDSDVEFAFRAQEAPNPQP